jgi:7-cyano-7-deazaguanine reductase
MLLVSAVQSPQGFVINSRETPMSSMPSTSLETFENPQMDRDYTIRIDTPEFTCLCPITGQPDFATIQLEYIADQRCLELKSLKLYFWSYRDQGAFHEAVTNQILSDLVAAISPRFMRVSAEFNVRGGIYTQVIAEHRADNWVAPEPVVLPR